MATGVVKRGLGRGVEVFVCGALPMVFGLLPLGMLVLGVGLSRSAFTVDLHPTWEAATRLAHGNRDLYALVSYKERDGWHHANYVYPPILAIVLVPLGLMSFALASSIFIVVSSIAVAAAIWFLGVRDWRCYGVVFLWGPVVGGIALANITAFLLLGIALAWRFRERNASSVCLAFLGAVKLFLWPLLAWELRISMRRFVGAVLGAGVMVFGSWAVIGFAGLGGYWGVLRRVETYWQSTGYGLAPLLKDAGVSSTRISLLLTMAAVAGVIAIVVSMRNQRLDERQSLILLIAVALVFSPVSWLHYAMLLIVPIALTTPRLNWQWFLPISLWVTPSEKANGSVWRIVFFCVVVTATSASAFRLSTLARERARRIERFDLREDSFVGT